MRRKQLSKLGMKILTLKLRIFLMENKKEKAKKVKMLMVMLKFKKHRMKMRSRRMKEKKRNLSRANNVFGVFGHQSRVMRRKKNHSHFLMFKKQNLDLGVKLKRIMNRI